MQIVSPNSIKVNIVTGIKAAIAHDRVNCAAMLYGASTSPTPLLAFIPPPQGNEGKVQHKSTKPPVK